VDLQKKTLSASERDEAERAAWRAAAALLDPADFIFIDETGTHLDLTRSYAWAPHDERAYDVVPRNRGQATSVIASLTLAGIGPSLSVRGGTTGAVFLRYVCELLVPTLRAGQIVIVDNVGAHRPAAVREVIEAAGARLWYLPAYSPDFAPIEHAFSKCKAVLRRLEARTRDGLETAIASALATVTAADAHGWFRHCGYLPKEQDF
jgi:transposase